MSTVPAASPRVVGAKQVRRALESGRAVRLYIARDADPHLLQPLVQKAVEFARKGKSLEEIRAWMEQKMDTAKSYLIPADFDYLRRGGRLSPLVSHVGKMVGLAPVMTQTDDGCRLTVAGIRRGYSHAVKYVCEALKKKGIGAGWRVYISHAASEETAELTQKLLKAAVPEAYFEVAPLSPAFITQGGPGCVAVQYIAE